MNIDAHVVPSGGADGAKGMGQLLPDKPRVRPFKNVTSYVPRECAGGFDLMIPQLDGVGRAGGSHRLVRKRDRPQTVAVSRMNRVVVRSLMGSRKIPENDGEEERDDAGGGGKGEVHAARAGAGVLSIRLFTFS